MTTLKILNLCLFLPGDVFYSQGMSEGTGLPWDVTLLTSEHFEVLEGDMTKPVLAMKSDRKKFRTFSSWFRACSCWSVVLSMTPATKAPSSVDKPC